MGEALGDFDGPNGDDLLAGSVAAWPQLASMLLALGPPRHPLELFGFGLGAIWPAQLLAQSWFRGDGTQRSLADWQPIRCNPLIGR